MKGPSNLFNFLEFCRLWMVRINEGNNDDRNKDIYKKIKPRVDAIAAAVSTENKLGKAGDYSNTTLAVIAMQRGNQSEQL